MNVRVERAEVLWLPSLGPLLAASQEAASLPTDPETILLLIAETALGIKKGETALLLALDPEAAGTGTRINGALAVGMLQFDLKSLLVVEARRLFVIPSHRGRRVAWALIQASRSLFPPEIEILFSAPAGKATYLRLGAQPVTTVWSVNAGTASYRLEGNLYGRSSSPDRPGGTLPLRPGAGGEGAAAGAGAAAAARHEPEGVVSADGSLA